MKYDLDDRTRILLHLVRDLYLTSSMKLFAENDGGVRFERVEKYRNLTEGDLVLCITSGIHAFTVGFVTEVFEDGCALREIGSNQLRRITNESLARIIGLRPEQLWERDQIKFDRKVRRAFKLDWKVLNRYGSVKFQGNDATLVVLPPYGNAWFRVEVPDYRHKTIKQIHELMCQAGYGKLMTMVTA